MKQLALAATLIASAGLAFAQAPAPAAPAAMPVEKPKCEPKPEYPGKLAMQSDLRRNSFKREIDAYKACMMAYVETQKVQQQAHLQAANGAITDYNDTMKKIAKEQEESKD
jgi:acyl-CoA synthetase (NDP forming)